MASAAVDLGPQHFACKCLNVRLRTSPSDSTPPESSDDPGFEKIHVGDDGIQVAHPQLTLRVKSQGVSIPGTTRWSRFTTLTCLNCDLAVYRVHQVISSEVEAKDLPLLPSDDWAEQEIMKSLNGWIEVHKDCLSGEDIIRAASSEGYSRIYSVILPPAPDTTPISSTTWISPESTASSTPTPAIPVSYLSGLPPLLPPPPFTPSHPAFTHILSLAKQDSQSLRDAADQELARIVRAKAAEVEAKEAELKVEIERLWSKFRQGLDKVQQDRPHAPSSSVPWTSPARTNDHRNNVLKAPVAIPGFIPVSVTAPTRSTPPPLRNSGISESIRANSHFPAMVNKPHNSNGSEATSTHSDSPTLVPSSANERDVTSILHYQRRIDDSVNTAASYRYFMNLEEEMGRAKKERKPEADLDHDETVGMGLPGPSKASSNNGDGHSSDPGASGDSKGKAKEKEKEKKEPKNKSKHVHFNVQPDVKEVKTSTSKKSSNPSRSDSENMLFYLDDDVAREVQPEEVQPSTLPLLEQPSVPPRRRPGPQRTAGLPASFSALRPASLPAPSHMRSGRPPNIDTYSNNIMLSLPRPPGHMPKATNGEHKDKEDTTDQDTSEDTTDSSPRPTSDSESDSEDYGEEHHYHNRYGIPGSLPINIVSSIRPREVLSLTSYQQKPSVERQQQQVAATAPTNGAMHPKRMTSTAMRKATYLERDRSRSIDPGNLDFVAEVDEEDEEEQGGKRAPVSQSAESGERGRKQALKILQARAEIPEEGMWRSLAS